MSLTSRRRTGLAAATGVMALSGAACGGADSDYQVVSKVLAGPSTQEVLVFAPEKGSWPVVFALHGINGRAEDMAELGRRLAARGVVVFAPTYRTDLSSRAGKVELVRDAECAYRFSRSVSAEYGGDLSKPVTFVGWSIGATFAIQGGLDEEIDPTGQYLSCFSEVPRADVIVALSGCYYEYGGNPSYQFSPEEWTNREARVTLVAGGDDASCMPWQSDKAAAELGASGYPVKVVAIEGATHAEPVFHTIVDDRMVPAPDATAGDRTVEIITQAIADAAEG